MSRSTRPKPKAVFARDERGQRLIWIRPSNPAVALHLAQLATRTRDAALFNRIPSKVQEAGGEYTFVGYVSADRRRVVTDKGVEDGLPEPGDSMMSEDAVRKVEEN